MNLNITAVSVHTTTSGFWQVLKNTEVRTFSSRVGSQLTFGCFILYLDRGKAESETKHGGHKRQSSIDSEHDGRFLTRQQYSDAMYVVVLLCYTLT